MRLLRLLPVVLLSVLLFVSCNKSRKDGDSDEAGMTDADYVEQATFTDFDGNKVEVSDFKGKVVMIDFWETWCKPCLASFPVLHDLMKKYPDDFIVLAVTPGFMNTQEDAEEFKVEHDYNFTYLMDTNKLHEKLGVQGIPFKVFVDAEGNFIKAQMGSHGAQEDYRRTREIIEKHRES